MSIPSDIIRLRGMAFYGHHGALPQERDLGQRFVIDLELSLDLRPAGVSDALNQTVNYGYVYNEVRTIVEGPPYHLIEALAESIAAQVLRLYTPVAQVRVRVVKPSAPIAGILEAAEVEIVRTR